MNRVCSIFSQILKLVPRQEFEVSVKEHKAERHARGFSSWAQMIAMMFCQLGHAQSLREITGGLTACEGTRLVIELLRITFRIRATASPKAKPQNVKSIQQSNGLFMKFSLQVEVH